MEYVEGKPIDVYAAGLDMRRKIALFLKVCAAVGYLHRNLVIHRDLKPANILVTAEGEAKLLDFGIAKMLDLTTDSTVTSMRMLTPDYASPEQVTGGAMSTATDVYSLGAVLYKLLTGASPHQFESDSAGAIALAISTGKITPPAKAGAGFERRSRDDPDEGVAHGSAGAIRHRRTAFRRSGELSGSASDSRAQRRLLVSNAKISAPALAAGGSGGACRCRSCRRRARGESPTGHRAAAVYAGAPTYRTSCLISTPRFARSREPPRPGK